MPKLINFLSPRASGNGTTSRPEAPQAQPKSRTARSAGAALDILLTDAAVGNPATRIVRRPGEAAQTAARVLGRPTALARRGSRFAGELARIARGRSDVTPPKGDRRFADAAWQHNWLFRRMMQTYLAAGMLAEALIEDAELDWRQDTTARFVAGNVHDALAPTNFPWSNPAVIKQTIDQGGANLVKGLRRAGRDVGARRLPAMVDTSKFAVGDNLAVSEGAIVLRTEVFELIHYKPAREDVHEIPLLIVPPTINKYYILDLAPGRSLVEYLLAQGQQVFMISWRNPGQTEGHYDLDTYARAVRTARDAVANITGEPKVNLAAACSGGIITAGLLGHLADTGALGDEIESLTLMVCALDTEQAGTTSALARRELAAVAVAESARRGYVDGGQLGTMFAWLRPNDLVWSYVINNYLMGKNPPAFDILYWNQDSVRLAAGLHRDFVRLALENAMATPGRLKVRGSKVDLRQVDIDVYAIAGLNDHIVPWQNVYRGAQLFGGATRFVLSTSGHIQALINPPDPGSRSSYRVTDEMPPTDAGFLRDIPTTSGSWWPDWADWLAARAGERVPAPAELGSDAHPPTANAPGSYVLAA